MRTIRSILVDIDAAAGHHTALDQAVSVATRCNARLKIVDVLPWVPQGVRHYVTCERERDLVEHRRERLGAIADGLPDVAVTTEVLRGRPGTALIQEVLRSEHDLLVRAHGRDDPGRARPFGAIDMELLRQCPCPVWLVAGRAPHWPWRILAAIRASAEEESERTLNATILDWAVTLYRLGDAQLTILQAWTLYGAGLLKAHMPEAEFADLVEQTRRTEQDAIAQVGTALAGQVKGAMLESVYGEPEDLIARFVESHGIDVVVMGTVARTGLAGLVMGNTAEGVLRRLRGSVLAVKPPGFQTPVAVAIDDGERK